MELRFPKHVNTLRLRLIAPFDNAWNLSRLRRQIRVRMKKQKSKTKVSSFILYLPILKFSRTYIHRLILFQVGRNARGYILQKSKRKPSGFYATRRSRLLRYWGLIFSRGILAVQFIHSHLQNSGKNVPSGSSQSITCNKAKNSKTQPLFLKIQR